MKAIKIRSAGSKADIEAFEKQKVNLVKEQRELRTEFLKKMFPYLWRLERHKKFFSEVSDKSIAQTIETLVKLGYPFIGNNPTWQDAIKGYVNKEQAKAKNNSTADSGAETHRVNSDIPTDAAEMQEIEERFIIEMIVIEKMNKAWQNRKTKLREEVTESLKQEVKREDAGNLAGSQESSPQKPRQEPSNIGTFEGYSQLHSKERSLIKKAKSREPNLKELAEAIDVLAENFDDLERISRWLKGDSIFPLSFYLESHTDFVSIFDKHAIIRINKNDSALTQTVPDLLRVALSAITCIYRSHTR